MKCLSIRQPWASAIFELGKDIENRAWTTNYRGPLLIHAARAPLDESGQEWFDRIFLGLVKSGAVSREHLEKFKTAFHPPGVILGMVQLIGVSRGARTDSVWASPDFNWQLRDPILFEEPIGWRGSQGLFDVPDDVILDEEILSQ